MRADVPAEERSTANGTGVVRDDVLPATRPFEGDDEFARALRARNPTAWRQLFEEQYQRVYAYAYTRTGIAADAEEIASNVFTEAVRGIGRVRFGGAPVAAWLLRIAHNETVDLLKRRRTQAVSSIDGVADVVAPADATARAEGRDVRAALGRLKPEHRDVIYLRLIEGRSVAETAQTLGKSEGAVKGKQMRALRALKQKLESGG